MNSDFLEPYKQRWLALQPRERTILIAGTAFLFIFFVYAGIWAPASKRISKLRTAVPKAEQDLAQMQVNAAQIKRLQIRKPSKRKTGSVLTRLEKTAVSKGLRKNISKMEPDGSDRVRLTIEEISFNDMISLLADLQKQSGLRVESLTLDSNADNPGIVSARMALHGNAQ